MNNPAAKTILIVDNDPNVLTALAARLTGLGYRCLKATSGSQALGLFETDAPDLVISDLNMPQGDGASLAATIRRFSNVPIILISGFKDAYRKALRGVPDISFLHKPFDTEDLIALIGTSLEQHQSATHTDHHLAA